MALEPLQTYQERAALSPEAFGAFCPQPILIVFPYVVDEDGGGGFHTVVARAGALTPRIGVARVMKRPDANVFASMVTIGRAPNNDIVLQAAGVSKFHAFLQERGGAWTITDAGSSFGTLVGGRTLAARTEHADLRSGVEVRLGSVRTLFAVGADARRLLLDVDALRAP